MEIYVYEEGYASYTPLRRPNSFKNKFFLKIALFLKIRNYSGGGSKVNGIYLYTPEKFISQFGDVGKQLLPFERTFKEQVLMSSELREQTKGIDFEVLREKDVIIFMSSWNISSKAVEYCKKHKAGHILMLKLHPHIKDKNTNIDNCFDIIIPNNVIFEYIYYNIHEVARSITIVHQGTYAVNFINFEQEENVSEIVFRD